MAMMAENAIDPIRKDTNVEAHTTGFALTDAGTASDSPPCTKTAWGWDRLGWETMESGGPVAGGAAGGDGNVTESIAYVDGNSTNDRATLYGYDWRDRLLWTMADDHTQDPNHPGYTRKTYTFNTYDNADDVLNTTRYYDLANTEGLPDNTPNLGDPVIGESGAAFDALGQEYQSISYNASGTIAAISNIWYDADGNVIMTQAAGTQEFTKTIYDGLGDAVVTCDGYDPEMPAIGTASAYAEAEGIGPNDIILTQADATFDPAGDETFEADYNRLPTASGTEALDSTGNAGQSQVSYTASWFDGIGGGTGVNPTLDIYGLTCRVEVGVLRPWYDR